MPTNLASPSICTSWYSVDPSLHDAGSIGPGNCPGSTVEERGDPCYWTVYHDPDATGLPRSGPPHMSYCRGPKSGYKMLPQNNPDRIRQDPQTTGLRPGRTAHPLGTPPHPASATALALGNPVQSRLGPVASHSTPGLTAPVRHCPNVPAN